MKKEKQKPKCFEILDKLEKDPFTKSKISLIIEFCSKVELSSTDFHEQTFNGNQAITLLKKLFKNKSEASVIKFLNDKLLNTIGLIEDFLNVGEFNNENNLYGLKVKLTPAIYQFHQKIKFLRKDMTNLKSEVEKSYFKMKNVMLQDFLFLILERQLNYETMIFDMKKKNTELSKELKKQNKTEFEKIIVEKNNEIEELKKEIEDLKKGKKREEKVNEIASFYKQKAKNLKRKGKRKNRLITFNNVKSRNDHLSTGFDSVLQMIKENDEGPEEEEEEEGEAVQSYQKIQF